MMQRGPLQAALRGLRWQHEMSANINLGARAVFELMDEIARYNPEIAAEIDRRGSALSAADAKLLVDPPDDRTPSLPLQVVEYG